MIKKLILGLFLLGGVVTFAQDKPAKKEKTSCCSSSDKKSSKKSKCSSTTKANETIVETVEADQTKDVNSQTTESENNSETKASTNKK